MIFRTLVVWVIGLPITLVLFFVVLLALLVRGGGNAVHSIGVFGCRILLALSGVRVTVKGLENLPREGPVIILSNHQGAYDIPVLQAFIPMQFRWVAKKSLFSIPVIGWSMRFAGYIEIEREHVAKALRSKTAPRS
jgi:1-acyl-sn-glycerol-3-phosphate acyltransferase